MFRGHCHRERGGRLPAFLGAATEPSVSHLINVFAVDAISAVAWGTGTALPAAIRVAGTLGASKAGVGQASI